jgi:vWA-MoxR associated protein C-terminal domain/vWA-MoxR associated protein middle region 0/Effector-associated domain 2
LRAGQWIEVVTVRLGDSPVHHSIVVLDIAQFGNSERSDLHRVTAVNGLRTAVRQALLDSKIEPEICPIEDRGDGCMILLPASIPKGQLVDHLPPRLTAGLLRYNATCAPEARIRLRMSLHAGDVRVAEHGIIVGNEVNFACRLVDSDSLRRAQRKCEELISIIVSDSFYREVVVHEPAAEPESYQCVRVQEKEIDTTAWIRSRADITEAVDPSVDQRTQWQTRMWITPSVNQNALWPLVQALHRLSSLADRKGRDLLIRMLCGKLQERLQVEDHRQPSAHLFSIAEACQRHPDGLAALIEVLERLEEDTEALAAVRHAVRDMTALDLWPPEERKRLFNLLAGVVVPDIPQIYREVAGPAAPGLHEQTTYLEVFRALEQLNAGPSGVPKPLIFIEHVAAKVRTELAIELRRWADQQAGRMELRAELQSIRQDLQNATGTVPSPQPSSDAYLVVQLQREGPAGEQFRLSHWRQLDLSSDWAPIRGKDMVGSYTSMKHEVAALVEQVETDWAQYQPNICIEFILGYENLNLDVDQWPWETNPVIPEPLGCRYSVVVRSLERMTSPKFHGSWRKRWKEFCAQLEVYGAIPQSACYQRPPIEKDDLRGLMATFNRKSDLVALILSEPPQEQNSGRNEVAIGVRAGAPVIVWHRDDCRSEEFIESIKALLHSRDDSYHLLERARLARVTAFEEGPEGRHFGGQLTMLYDDPFRVVVPNQPMPPEEVSVA